MVTGKTLFGAALVSFGIFSCASSFPYKHYGLDAQSYEGRLLGPDETDDLPLRLCEPTEHQQGLCIVVFIDEWEKLRADYRATKERLKKCEGG